MYSDRNQVLDNRLHENTVGAALMFSKNNRFENNRCDHNLRYGMLFKDVDSSESTGNQLGDNGEGLVMQQLRRKPPLEKSHRRQHRRDPDERGVERQRDRGKPVRQQRAAGADARRARQPLPETGAPATSGATTPASTRTATGSATPSTAPAISAGYLADAYPLVRVLEAGPAYDAIRFAEAAFPVIDFPGVIDHPPLAAPPSGSR